MRRLTVIAAVFCAALIPLQLAAQEKLNEEGKKLHAIFDEEWEWAMKQFPPMATYFGDYRWNDQLGSFGLEALERNKQHDFEVLKKIEQIDRTLLSEQDKVNFDLYIEQRKQSIAGHEFPATLMPMNQQMGIHSMLPMLPQICPFKTARHYDDYISRLRQVSRVMDEMIELMQEGLKRGVTPPKVTVRAVADQIKSQIVEDPTKSVLYFPFLRFPDSVSEDERERLKTEAAAAIAEGILPAYQKLHDYWLNEYYPKCRATFGYLHLPNGKQWYAYLAKSHTTTDLTPEEIHQIGLDEVKRIRAEMDKVIEESGFEGSFEEFAEYLRTDPKFYYTKAQDLVTGYRDICKRIDAELPRLFRTLPRLTFGVKEVPMFTAPSQTTAYYNPGSLEAGRSGTYYVNTYKIDTRPKWEMEALSIHEAIPGHHFQISLAQELTDLPQWRRNAGYTAYVEGWALYCESLGPDLGFYKDPYSKFGQLTYEIWRAIRLVVDTGIHYYGWDRQKAIDYFKANSPKQEHDITVEVDRYMVMPAQALAYKIGELKIKELRAFAEAEMGESFDIREFHDELLLNGAVPLSVLEKMIKEYVAEKKAGQPDS
ncbi:MAG TPA: DUF885 domain-containing protein [Acidobacteriota bacterium]|nr:DUF885 domain-containing protein [Acidobacteriota bacterium]